MIRLVSVPCSTKKQAMNIAQTLLQSKLAACVNIIPHLESHFWWKRKIERSKEVLVMIKTKTSLVSKVMDKIKKLHSYECPVIEVIAVEKMNPEARKWMKETLK